MSLALSLVTGGAGASLGMLGKSASGNFFDLFKTMFGGMAGIPGMATGGIVPPGFPNDSYPAFLSSGEKVIPSPIPLGAGGGGNINIRGNAIARGKDLLFTFQNADRDLVRRRGF